MKEWVLGFELWFTKAFQIAIVMVRGAYWLSERRRLFTTLGEQAYAGFQATKPLAFEPVAEKIQWITDKLQAEEQVIQRMRAKDV